MYPQHAQPRQARALGAVLIALLFGGVAGGTMAPALTQRPKATAALPNLVQDAGFESGVSSFTAQDASSAVTQVDKSPLGGARSLRVSIIGYGNNVWWSHNFEGGLARRFSASARLRSDRQSSSKLNFCVMTYYADQKTALQCTPVSGTVGDKGRITARVDLDPAKRIASVRIRLYQEGSAPVTFTMDDVVARLEVIEAPPERAVASPGTSGTAGPTGGGADVATESARPECAVPAKSAYPGFEYKLPATRPFISLSQYTQTNKGAPAYGRFKSAADQALAGRAPYGYSATHSVIMHALTSNAAYIDDAITRVETMVAQAETAIAGGGRPLISGDSYLEVGSALQGLALAYDHGYSRLTDLQRERWAGFAEQTLQNVWNPKSASWGGKPHPWSGWSVCDPGNNYHFSFLRATMLWALASHSKTWLEFLQTQKFPPLIDYYAQLPGGGSREGTGYGTAQMNLFLNYLYWSASTTENLASLTPHTRQTIDYWIHATVPTLDRYAPIGDQSRSSMPELYDYHENLVHTAVVLSPGTMEARRGAWWLKNNSVKDITNSFNVHGDLLQVPEEPLAPTDLVYHATGVGALFARSSWSTDATWLAVVAGKYDQSHAHQDQGSFTLFRRNWLAVTGNIWSKSGINQNVGAHNGLRFERADGTTIGQSASATVESTMAVTNAGGLVRIEADLSNAYWRERSSVPSWKRTFEFTGNTLKVSDVCTVAPGVKAIFQLQTPTLPAQDANGTVTAGGLVIRPVGPVTVAWSQMPGPEYTQGYRIDFTSTAGCAFSFELDAR